jgi:hypothetical protein
MWGPHILRTKSRQTFSRVRATQRSRRRPIGLIAHRSRDPMRLCPSTFDHMRVCGGRLGAEGELQWPVWFVPQANTFREALRTPPE